MFPSLIWSFSLPGVSSLVRCLFPLGSFGFRASSFVSVLFLWALLWLYCVSSRQACFAIGLFLSLLVPGSWFLFFSFSLCLVLWVPSHTPLTRWSSFWCLATARQVGALRAVSHLVSFSGAVISLTCIPGFHAMPVSSFTLLPRSLHMLLGTFCRRSSGVTFVVLSVLCVFLSCSSCYFFSLSSFAFVSPHSLLFSPRSLSRTFSKGALSFFAFSPLVRLPLPLLLGVLCLLLLLPLLPFGLIACGVLQLHGLFCAVFFSSFLEAATWSSFSVFTSFYPMTIQFSSSGVKERETSSREEENSASTPLPPL